MSSCNFQSSKSTHFSFRTPAKVFKIFIRKFIKLLNKCLSQKHPKAEYIFPHIN